MSHAGHHHHHHQQHHHQQQQQQQQQHGERVPLQGSSHPPPPGATESGTPPPSSEQLSVTIVVRGQNAEQLHAHLTRLHAGESPPHLSHADYSAQYGSSADDIAAVKSFAASHQLSVVSEHAGRHVVVVSGTAAQVAAAFGVRFANFQHGAVQHRGYHGEVLLPSQLSGVVEAVLGLDNRPVARPHFEVRSSSSAAAAGADTSLTPLQVARLYGFPSTTGSSKYNIALIELGGGYNAADLQSYWQSANISPAPTVVAVGVDGGTNTPGGDADAEVQLDIEVAGSIASAATIAVYFTPNTDAGFLDAITTATHDSTYSPAVMSISWGSAESTWPAATQTSFDNAFAAAAVLGISVFAASGDNGSSDGVSGAGKHVDFPASSPHVTGCGGTTLTGTGTTISSEAVWSGSGGGVSSHFALPTWQHGLKDTPTSGKGAALKKRGVPDVSGNADPTTGYQISVNGQAQVVGGTSAVAPLWAGLTAVVCAAQGARQGLINPQLYANASTLRDVTQGNNGGFEATKGWDACSGLGTPSASTLQPTAAQ